MDPKSSKGLLLVLVAVVSATAPPGCRNEPRSTLPTASETSSPSLAVDTVHQQIKAFCGDCHATPVPSDFPRDGWFHEVDRGFNFYYESGRVDLTPPAKKDVLAYYRSHAPIELELPTELAPLSDRVRFSKQDVAINGGSPAVADLNWMELDEPLLSLCDMRTGLYQELSVAPGNIAIHREVQLNNPCHVELTDLDANGRLDIVVADLGSFLPEDHDRGRVVWLPDNRGADTNQAVVLASGLGRIADVRVGDFDGDGDSDLVVAEFGWQKTGRILLLRNDGMQDEIPQFSLTTLDDRHGTIHVPTADFNNDGRLDFLALISQEHEQIEIFVNEGSNRFRPERIYDANNPSYGSSGIEIVDLDQDGDLDVLYTNGDTLDSFYLKPYHAVHWLENQGDRGWQDHILTNMPGVMRALPADLDGDGDLDIVAIACVPGNLMAQHRHVMLDSLIWLEQTEPGVFVRHALEQQDCIHTALEVADFDGDGDVDIAVGNFTLQSRVPLTIWWNETTSHAAK